MKKLLVILLLVVGVCMAELPSNRITSNVVTLTSANVAYEIMPALVNLRKAEFTNDSDAVIYINEKYSTPTTNFGIRLNAAGGSYSIDLNNLSTYAFYAICASDGKAVRVSYGTRN